MIFAFSIFVCVIAIAALSNVSLWVERWQVRREREAEQEKADYDADKPPNRVPTVQPVESGIHSVHRKEEEHHAKERRYWRRQLEVSRNLNRITFIGAIVGLFGLAFIYAGLIESKDATIENNRAWVGVINASLSSAPSDPKVPVHLTISYGNYGKDPASYSNIEIVPWLVKVTDWQNTQKTLSVLEKLRDSCRSVTTILDGLTVFPLAGSGSDSISSYELDDSSIKTVPSNIGAVYKIDFSKVSSGDDILAIGICIVYQTFGITKHTAACFFYNKSVTQVTQLNLCPGTYAD